MVSKNKKIEPFSGSRFHDNRDRVPAGEEPCAVCGRGIKRGSPAFQVEVEGGGSRFTAEGETADETDPGYMGGWLVGSDCAARLRAQGTRLTLRKP